MVDSCPDADREIKLGAGPPLPHSAITAENVRFAWRDDANDGDDDGDDGEGDEERPTHFPSSFNNSRS